MESNSYHEESINSSEELVELQENVDLGVGRSYECVFCKRGFNTAQALGGHMNIHRKDRARNKPSTTSNKQEETPYNNTYTGPRLYQQIMPPSSYNHHQSLQNHHFSSHDDDHDHHMPPLNYATYFPASTSSSRPLMYGDDDHPPYDCDRDYFQNHPSIDPLIPGDWRMSLSLTFAHQDLETSRQVIVNQKEELDLELRLGYDS